jgi:hypothetical protein
VKTVKVLVEMGGSVLVKGVDGSTPLHWAANAGYVELVKLLLDLGADMLSQTLNRSTPLHVAAAAGNLETVKVLTKMGSSALAQDADRRTPPQHAESKGNETVVSFLRKIAKNKRRSKSTTAPVADPAAQAAAEAAVTATAELLIAEEDDLKQPPPSKLNNSNKARKNKNQRKANPDELDNGLKVHDEASIGSVASSSGRRDNGGEIYEMGRDVACHSKPDGEMDAHAGPVFNNGAQGHNESKGHSISRNVKRMEAGNVECEPVTSHSRVEQPATTQAECQQQKERERKGKQKQRKKATMCATREITRATLEEALARVDTAEASLDTLNSLDAVIMSAKPVVSSCASSDLLPELLGQAGEKSLNLLREVRAMAKAAENKDTCVIVCLESPKNALLLPCKHIAMCAECTTAVLASSSQPQCPVCRSRIVDCVYGVFF